MFQESVSTQPVKPRVGPSAFPSCTTSRPTPSGESDVFYIPCVHVQMGERALAAVRRLNLGSVVEARPPLSEFVLLEQTPSCAPPLADEDSE